MSTEKIVFAGSPEFAAQCLTALLEAKYSLTAVYTQPDRPAGRGRKLQASAVKQLALQHGLTVMQPSTLKSEEAQQQLRALAPDLMVVVAYGLLLPPAVLEIPRLGCINVHASLLPRWRGAAPIQRAIAAGDAKTGITIMQMEQGLDSGPMLLKVETAIQADDTAATLHDRLAALGAQALLEALPGVLQQTLVAQKQNDAEANYAAKLTKAEAEIDWQQDADSLARKIRAFDPFPVAYTKFNQAILRLWQGTARPGNSSAPPGSLIDHDKNGILVACGSGQLYLTQVQMPGKKPISAVEFHRAYVKGPTRFG